MTEVLDSVRKDRRRAMRGARSPWQQHAPVRNLGDGRFGWRPGERRRLWRPVEDDRRVAGGFHDERRSASCLTHLTHRPTRVHPGVRLPQIYQQVNEFDK